MRKRPTLLLALAIVFSASGASAEGELTDIEMAIKSMTAAYHEADADPARGRKFVKDFCELLVEGGVYSDKKDDKRRDIECKSDTYQLSLSFMRSNGNVVSSYTWFRPAKWEATVKAITKITGVPYVKRSGHYDWSGPKNKDGWWFELSAKRHRGGTLLLYGWTNNP
jgi:hypothetical protein